MDFSVIIPTYNRSEILAMTLDALADQQTSAASELDYEVIVVDDGSTDHTGEIVRSRSETYPVKLVYLYQSNRKQGAARNRGATCAKGRILVFLGDDTVPENSFLRRHLESHERHNDPRLVVIGYTPWAPDFPRTRFMQYIGEQGWQFGFSLIEDPENVPVNFFYASNLSIRRDFFLESGGFDEGFREYGWEDVELSIRLKEIGMRLIYNARAVAFHYHPTTIRSFIRRQQKTGQSAWTLYRKHPEAEQYLNIEKVPSFSLATRLKMWALTQLCCWTERLDWPDLSSYYPDLMSYYYCLGIHRGRHD